MVLLLDTHVLLWALDKPDRLPEEVRRNIETPDNEVYFSAVSIWEIAIKTSLGRANFPYSPEQIAQAAQETGFIELPVTSSHAAKIIGLPLYHHDPFDRLLIAQTLLMPARLLTADSALTPYSELVWLI
ncbi:PIN domain nuclease, a component of toxin-antitoxin system (PIN domain) [Nitrosospira sp. Nl5]|uniref:type II toxin-antitoxin system VapC family toxin n=1 Tax=Nitrosospira sp. Nl5 TaxID=200120 RepID=UPI00088805D0|nr:type II toxin-antitoxin system VapC family toxin [Nitrosospira sp. Nl5]SCY42237.1 PIN domain nuclease, a component of toxin-antitoxin system (PIN domain) [Nitrosospira sp. Nl5]